MNTLAAAQALAEKALADVPDIPGLWRCAFEFSPESNDFLAWLGAQPGYPQFYWRSREGHEEAATLGAACTFLSLNEAQAFLRQYADTPGLRAWGLNAFDPQTGLFFIPRLELRREGDRAWLMVNLYSACSQRKAAQALKPLIHNLQPARQTLLQPAPRRVSRCDTPQAQQWAQLVGAATNAIERGDFAKVVLARATDLRFVAPPDASALMAASREANHHCYHFYLAFSAREAFLGSTPERLWRRNGLALDTEALAGAGENLSDDALGEARAIRLLNGDKKRRENAVGGEGIREALQGVAPSIKGRPAD
ncbi:isochorismate synthase, partial [Cronobacter malonaticus]|uniref:chorismate-binding protein n=1 Tax=Cronobacter malonaticus TaxID=413503 RepID=UPI000F5C8503